jgi:PilZ domain
VDFGFTQERRSDARFGGAVLGSAHATLRPGYAVTLIDLSSGGALVQAARPLRPGTRAQLQFERGARRFALAAHVLRCAVWAIDADAGVLYRGAVRFENRCDTLWEANTRGGYELPGGGEKHRAGDGQRIPASLRQRGADVKRGQK